MSALKIAREYFPDYSDAELDSIVWGKTGFPGFFSGDKPVEEQFRDQLKEESERRKQGKTGCPRCGREMDYKEGCYDLCERCQAENK
jgi:hypothetical protein